MPQKTSYLANGGRHQFIKDTSRWYASRNNELLLKIDAALELYAANRQAAPDVRATALGAIGEACRNWRASKLQKAADSGSFRMPIVAAVQDEAEREWHIALLQLQKSLALKRQEEARTNLPGNMVTWKYKTIALAKTNPNYLSKMDAAKAGLEVKALDTHAERYDLELADPEHHMGQTLTKAFTSYKKSKDTHFRDYLEKLPKENQDILEQEKVYYMEDLTIRTLFEVEFSGGCMYSQMTPDLQRTVMAKRVTDAEETKKLRRELFSVARRQLMDTASYPTPTMKNLVGDGWACFVMSCYGVVYAGGHIGGQFHHSSFLCGAPVLAAGMIRVKNGKIEAISERNGHYKCDTKHMRQFLFLLRDRLTGVDWSQVEYFYQGGGGVKASYVLAESDEAISAKGVVAAIGGFASVLKDAKPKAKPQVELPKLTIPLAEMTDAYLDRMGKG